MYSQINTSIVFIGIFFSILIMQLMKKTIKISNKAYHNHRKIRPQLKLSSYFFFYVPWLSWQIIVSGIAVTKMVWNKTPVNPQIIQAQSTNKTNFGIMLLSNSITLTPGTVSIGEQDPRGVIKIHALHVIKSESIDRDIKNMDLQVTKLIRGNSHRVVKRLNEK